MSEQSALCTPRRLYPRKRCKKDVNLSISLTTVLHQNFPMDLIKLLHGSLRETHSELSVQSWCFVKQFWPNNIILFPQSLLASICVINFRSREGSRSITFPFININAAEIRSNHAAISPACPFPCLHRLHASTLSALSRKYCTAGSQSASS